MTALGRNPLTLPRARLALHEHSWITVQRSVELIDLRGLALRRLDLARADLLNGGPETYAHTARWAEALHWAVPAAAGLVWLSRQLDTAEVFVFFGDRLRAGDLVSNEEANPLGSGRGFERVLALAASLGVVITEP